MTQKLIAGLVAAGLVLVGLSLAVIAAGLGLSGQSAQRIQGAAQRAGIISELTADAHNYAEQVAAVLLFGKGQGDALGTARIDMERTLSRLNQATRAQISALSGMTQVANELPEVDATRRMIELYHAIDMSASRALVQQRDGKLAEAAQLFQAEVQFRLSNELQPLLDHSLAGEQDEIAAEQRGLQQLRTRIIVAAGLIGLAAIIVFFGLAAALWRAILKPVTRLHAGMAALAAGPAGPIAVEGHDVLAGLAGAFNDMRTAIAARQAALADAGTQLQAETDARTEQWQEANASLREVDERRAQFLADVSHQLRTPLTILRGEADVALRGKRRVLDLHQALERIQDQAAELGQLLEDLIAYARSDAESHVHEPAVIRLDAVVNAAVQEGQALAEPREITITAGFHDYESWIAADFRRLRQVLVIGFDNAIKHSPPGGRIEIETERAGTSVKVRILDQGVGVDPAEQPRLFERFFRGSAEAELLNQGLGIGLAIAKEIVERHGGSIEINNRPEGGAVLEITLPTVDGSPS